MILSILVLNEPRIENSAKVFLVALYLLCLGTAVGIYFSAWLGKIFVLLNKQHHLPYSALTNLSFACTSIGSLYLKKYCSGKIWVTIMLIVQCISVLIALFVAYNAKTIAAISPAPPETAVKDDYDTVDSSTSQSTSKILSTLFLFKNRGEAALRGSLLSRQSPQMSSTFFYLLLFCSAIFCSLATTFMANIGPLVSEVNDNLSDNEQIDIYVWSSIGQTIARVFWMLLLLYLSKQTINYKQLQTWTTLWATLFIGILFFIFTLALYNSHMPFIFASSVVSGAYGSMWVLNNAFPHFLPECNFAVVYQYFRSQVWRLCFFLCCSSYFWVLGVTEYSQFYLGRQQH
jgi:hypothetical protein